MGHLNQRGSVLILSLWVLIFLSLVGASLASRAQIELRLSHYPWEEVRLREVVREAVIECSDFWQKQSVLFTSFNQPWFQNPQIFKDQTLPDGAYTVVHDSVYGAEDETAKINLNQASPDVLARLFASHAYVVPAILDWRLPGPGHWDDVYATAGYGVRHGPFKNLEELLLVKGMTEDIFQDVEKELTVNTAGEVNINTASGRVLEALGLKTILVNKILTFRNGSDGQIGTADDGVFTTRETVLPLLKKTSMMTEDDIQSLNTLLQRRQLSVRSDRICLHILARLTERPVTRRFVIVAKARASSISILSWREIL